MIKGLKVGKYWFQPNMPQEIIEACKEELIRNEHFIPSWCEEIRVFWDCTGEETYSGNVASAYIDVNYAYRFANLTICPPFLNEEFEDRDTRIKHELAHIVTAPLAYYARDVVNMVANNDTISSLVNREIGEKTESVTEDLTNIFVKYEKAVQKQNGNK